MGLETGTYISDLISANPDGNDPLREGDDHLRLIKSVLKATMPGEAGNGWAKAIIATEDEINYLDGMRSNVQDQIDSIAGQEFVPQGTVMVFYQAAAPTGWTKISSGVGDRVLRVTTGTGGDVGGSESPTAFDTSHNHSINGTNLTTDQIPRHVHGIWKNQGAPVTSQLDAPDIWSGNQPGESGGPVTGQPLGSAFNVSIPSSGPEETSYIIREQTWTADEGGNNFRGVTSEAGKGGSHTHSANSAGDTYNIRHCNVILASKA